MVVLKMLEIFKQLNPKYPIDKNTDYSALLQIAYKIADGKKWRHQEVINGRMDETLASWQKIAEFIKDDVWLNTRSLSDIGTPKKCLLLKQKKSLNKKIIT